MSKAQLYGKVCKKDLQTKMNEVKILEKVNSKIDFKFVESLKSPCDLNTLSFEGQKVFINYIVGNMYTNGTNNRASKHGSPNTLINNLYKNQLAKKPTTVGVFAKLPKDLCNAINNSKKVNMTSDQIKAVVNKLLEIANKATKEYYCHIDSETIEALKEYVRTGDAENKKYKTLLKNALNFRTIFLDQERQKVSK